MDLETLKTLVLDVYRTYALTKIESHVIKQHKYWLDSQECIRE
jgi:hypothetical protein